MVTKNQKMFLVKPKLEKIEHKPWICGKCVCCNKELTLVYHTDQGTLGKNCFLTAIGYPQHKGTKSPILPDEQYENMAIKIMEQFDKPIFEEFLVKYFTENYFHDEVKSIKRLGLWHVEINVGNRIRNFDLGIDQPRYWVFYKFGLYPSDMDEKIRGSKCFNESWRIDKNKQIHNALEEKIIYQK